MMVVNSLIIPEWRNKMIIVSYKGRCLLDCTIRTDKKKPYIKDAENKNQKDINVRKFILNKL